MGKAGVGRPITGVVQYILHKTDEKKPNYFLIHITSGAPQYPSMCEISGAAINTRHE